MRLKLLSCALAVLAVHLARATPPSQSTPDYSRPAPDQDEAGAPQAQAAQPGFATGLFGASRANLLGDAFGLRPLLGRAGISLILVEVSEIFGNATGGINQGAAYNGLTTATLQLDTSRAFGLVGGTLNISALQIHGRNFSADNLATLQTASGIEAERATRLWEAWYDQSFLENQLDFRAGQQSIDQEFIVSDDAGLFVNTMMGWPLIPSVDLYAGGPAYPLSSLGARVRLAPHGPFTLLAGVYDDNPSGGPFEDDSQIRGAEQSGAKFHTGTGALWIAELQYALNTPSLGDIDRGPGTHGLPGTYKLGGYYDSATFPDQRTGITRRGNWTLYGVADQTVWQPDPYYPRAISVFARVMGAPGDRNLADFSINGGVTFAAPLPRRKFDTLGLGFGVAKISGAASQADFAAARLGSPIPIRSSETFVELTYQAQVAPWWIVQPDFQYVFTPGGGEANPNAPGHSVGNEAVAGVRTIITF